MQPLITKLQKAYPDLLFTAGEQFSWSPESGEIIYRSGTGGDKAIWSLLHESGHALLGHRNYRSDVELVRLEVDAWERARQLAADFGIKIDDDHIQNCLDTYRDWLYKRSICPVCGTKSLQQGDYVHYRCFNCHAVWKVTANRFCRAYRRQKGIIQALIN